MNKAIPEGGRAVKCARCGHQWRLIPDYSAEEAEEPASPENHEEPVERAAPFARVENRSWSSGEDDAETRTSFDTGGGVTI
jgi:hypothetical protein